MVFVNSSGPIPGLGFRLSGRLHHAGRAGAGADPLSESRARADGDPDPVHHLPDLHAGP